MYEIFYEEVSSYPKAREMFCWNIIDSFHLASMLSERSVYQQETLWAFG